MNWMVKYRNWFMLRLTTKQLCYHVYIIYLNESFSLIVTTCYINSFISDWWLILCSCYLSTYCLALVLLKLACGVAGQDHHHFYTLEP